MRWMKPTCLVATISLGCICVDMLASRSTQSAARTITPRYSQDSHSRSPISVNYICEAIKRGISDEAIANEIVKQEINFKANENTVNDLRKCGAKNKTIDALPCSDDSKYGFEANSEILWKFQTSENDQAVTNVAQSEKWRSHSGCYSLKLEVDLVGGHLNKSKGEAFVDMKVSAPSGTDESANLEGKEITAWVYLPKAAIGDQRKPNGVQLFVKDRNRRGEYGSWIEFSGYNDKWVVVSLVPSKEKPVDGHVDPEFDPTRIRYIGIKIGSGTGSKAIYRGPIYVDRINW